LIRKQRRAVEAAAAIFGNHLHIGTSSIQINIDDHRGTPQNANENYENNVGMEDEEEDLEEEEEEDEEQENGEESQIERTNIPIQSSLSPSVHSFVQTVENDLYPLPCNTLDFTDIERHFLELGDFISNPQSPMDLSSSIESHLFSPNSTSEDGLNGWDSNHKQFMPLSTETTLSINNPPTSSQTKSTTYNDSQPQPQMILSSELLGFGSHGIFSPSTSDSSSWMNVDSEPIPASSSHTTLVLENVDPTTLNNIMQLLIASNTKMTMKR
jgi:hypothetical protein